MMLYEVSYEEWNGSFSELVRKKMLSVGGSKEEAISNVKALAQSDARNFTAKEVPEVMGYKVSVQQAGNEKDQECNCNNCLCNTCACAVNQCPANTNCPRHTTQNSGPCTERCDCPSYRWVKG